MGYWIVFTVVYIFLAKKIAFRDNISGSDKKEVLIIAFMIYVILAAFLSKGGVMVS
jgi:hypothetical protein